jgi:DNA mismatch repair ATPase MutS
MIHFDLLKIGNSPKITTAEDVRADLELDKIIGIASNKDRLVAETWLEVLLLRDSSEDIMRYRQEAVKDALVNREAVQKMYLLAREAIEKARREVFIPRLDDPTLVVYETSKGIEILVDAVEKLLTILTSAKFSSKAFSELMSSLTENIDSEFISSAGNIAKILAYGEGIDFSVNIGNYNCLKNPVLLVPKERNSLISKILSIGKEYTFSIDPRDEAGLQVLADIKRWVLSQIATTMLNAYNRLRNFFEDLAKQLSFYIGVINMNDFFEKIGLPKTYPEVNPRKLSFENLYCLSLAISTLSKPTPNTLDSDVDGSFAILITGANRGGKTTFLKAIGQALLLTRAGLFVPAESFIIPTPGAIYTHFLREEERRMSYGKFEDEIRRFRSVVDSLKRGDYILMDESFSSTNPVEASIVAENIVSALVDSGINVAYITFLHDFIYRFTNRYSKKTVLLVPERLKDGTRTFRLVRGFIQPGYAMELWRKISATLSYSTSPSPTV